MKNKKGIELSMTFIIIVVAIALVTIVSIYLLKGLTNSVDANANLEMISTFRLQIDDMLNENAGATDLVILKPSSRIVKLCFIDYDKELSIETNDPYEKKVKMIANAIQEEYKTGNITQPHNFFLFTEDEFESYYFDKITVEPEEGIYCLDSAKIMRINLLSQGKKVLVK